MAQAPSGLLTGVVYVHNCGELLAGTPCEWDGQEVSITMNQPESGVVELPTMICERSGRPLVFVRYIQT